MMTGCYYLKHACKSRVCLQGITLDWWLVCVCVHEVCCWLLCLCTCQWYSVKVSSLITHHLYTITTFLLLISQTHLVSLCCHEEQHNRIHVSLWLFFKRSTDCEVCLSRDCPDILSINANNPCEREWAGSGWFRMDEAVLQRQAHDRFLWPNLALSCVLLSSSWRR